MEIIGLPGIPVEIRSYMDSAIKTMAFGILLFALLQCFFGYKLFKLQLAIIGFLVFGIVGGVIGFSDSLDANTAWTYGLIAGLLGAVFSLLFFRIGVFIFLASISYLIGVIATQSVEVSALLALIVGIVGIFMIKPVVIITTSVSGGLLAGSSLETVIGGPGFLYGLLLIAVGLYIQFKLPIKKESHVNDWVEENPPAFETGDAMPINESTNRPPLANITNEPMDSLAEEGGYSEEKTADTPTDPQELGSIDSKQDFLTDESTQEEVIDRLQCEGCAREYPSGVNYCVDCGAKVVSVVL